MLDHERSRGMSPGCCRGFRLLSKLYHFDLRQPALDAVPPNPRYPKPTQTTPSLLPTDGCDCPRFHLLSQCHLQECVQIHPQALHAAAHTATVGK